MESILQILLEIIKFTLPSVVVAVIAYLLISKLTEDNLKKLDYEIRKANNHTFTPIKLQAYERLVLLMERISPPTLIQEYNNSVLSALELKNIMLVAINTEFSHNISQQIYISNQAWTLTKLVKEEVIEFINLSFNMLAKDATGIELSKIMIDKMIENNSQPTQKAIDFLKAEIRLYF
ncbi:MAG: hypothetical protein J5I91_06830 [Bacteroidetes bacterium]|nr:hypothetical protein [Bacteroidota bacterium]